MFCYPNNAAEGTSREAELAAGCVRPWPLLADRQKPAKCVRVAALSPMISGFSRCRHPSARAARGLLFRTAMLQASTSRPPPAPLRVRSGNKTLLDLDAIRIISADCAYSATALAARLGISIRQLQRLFARQNGCSPRAWLRAERMQAAHRLLRRSSTIKEVAILLSFRQQSHFSRDFRSHFGYPPSTVCNPMRKSRHCRAATGVRVGCAIRSESTPA